MYFYRIIFLCYFLILCASTEEEGSAPMSKEERISLREEARKMFYHAFDAYMDNAFPADELMPLSCKGRWRGVTPSRGDLDDVLGNFTLTLVDSLDTLVVLGDFQEFDKGIRYVTENLNFDTDVVVSVFETNIRVLGGLLSAHVLADELRHTVPVLGWYDNQLLNLAEDLGRRLLPAFNTTTGIPHGRVNLRRGMHGLSHNRETCTACAGTIILEFAALSRLTGNPVYEQRAAKTMDRLWKTRHRTSDLMGTTIDVQSGDWVRKDSGVGAGIDSYYEYCLKAYILLGDNKYLKRFNRHYNAIKKYISRGPLMLAVYMHRPHLQSRNFMDALLAFWPGLQVMMGDVRPAVETHEMLYQVMQRHTFIPEAFTTDFQVHWGQHPLRPEFLESTYFLHRATGDDHYLRVGRDILRALQQHARVPCGYAAVNDVRTRVHEDRMDSFVLAETFKYLYMLFSDDRDLPVNIEKYIMTTEAHFLPLSLGQVKRNTTSRVTVLDEDDDDRARRTCPSTSSLQPEKVREPMRQMVGATAARPPARLRPINDPRQLHALSDMGISVLTLPDGRVQLLYTTTTARSANDAAEGLTFMREMSRWNSLSDADNGVQLISVQFGDTVVTAGPAHFGQEISGDTTVQGTAALVAPSDACSEILNKMEVANKIGIAFRGQCTFTQKVRYMQLADIKLAIIIDNVISSSAEQSALFAMSNDGKHSVDVAIPSAFLYSKEGQLLLEALEKDPELIITVAEKGRFQKVNTCSDNTCQNSASAPERESFDHLKTVLADLVAQFELSLNNEETPKKNYKFPQLVYNKDKFLNEESKIDSVLGMSSETPTMIKITSNEAVLKSPESQPRVEDISRDSSSKDVIEASNSENNGDKDDTHDPPKENTGEESGTEDTDAKEDPNNPDKDGSPGDKTDSNNPPNRDRGKENNPDDKGDNTSDEASARIPKVVVTDYDAEKKAASEEYRNERFTIDKVTPDLNLVEFGIEPEMDMKEFIANVDEYKKTMKEDLNMYFHYNYRYYQKYAEERGIPFSNPRCQPDAERAIEGAAGGDQRAEGQGERGQREGEHAAGSRTESSETISQATDERLPHRDSSSETSDN